MLTAFSAFIWGSSFPAIKVALGGASDEVPFSFVVSFIRLLIAAVLGLAVMRALGRLDMRLFRQPVIWILGALNAVSFALQHAGVAFTTPSKTALLVNFNVVFVAILSRVYFKESLGARKMTGVALGVLGVVIVATRLDPSFLSGGEIAGDLMVFLAGFFWSLYIMFTKKAIDAKVDYVGLSVAVLATTTVFLILPLPFVNVSQGASAQGWGGILYLGMVSTLLPLLLWSRALKDLTATTSSVLMLLEVFFAVLLSVLIIGEVFLPVYALGGASILAGGILAASSTRNHTRAATMDDGPGK